jgi:hypothetical protein
VNPEKVVVFIFISKTNKNGIDSWVLTDDGCNSFPLKCSFPCFQTRETLSPCWNLITIFKFHAKSAVFHLFIWTPWI